eukprot:6190402-Pleurochrysis_carterae.AAC.4
MKLSETETMFTALFGHQVYSEFEAVLDIGRGQHGFASLLKHPKTGELAVAKQSASCAELPLAFKATSKY